LDSKESFAKQTKERMKELLDVELVGDNSPAETIRGQNKHSDIVPKELD
jgi:hypothetical protein